MEKKLTSAQRRLLREQGEEVELDIPDDPSGEPRKEVEEPKAKPGVGAEEVEDKLDEMPIEGEDEAEEGLDLGGLEGVEGAEGAAGAGTEEVDEDTTKVLTDTIDSLENMRADLSKKGLLVALELNDFSAQKRLDTLADELGSIIKGLNEKVLKSVSGSPVDRKQAAAWLSGEEAKV